MGQRLFTTAGLLLTLAIALLPAVMAAGVIAGGIYYVSGVLVVVIPSAIIACVLVAECFVAVELLGGVLDRTDVSAVSPAE